jgi:hypothetical protein
MGGTPKNIILLFSSPISCFFVTQSKDILYLLHIQKWLDFNQSLAFYYYLFIFFLVFIPGITRPGFFLRGLRRSTDAAGGAGHA